MAAPAELAARLRAQPSLAAAWLACHRADWLLWLARRGPLGDGRRRALVAAAAVAIAHADAPKVRSRTLETALAWANDDVDDPDPTGYSVTITSLLLAGVIAAAVELWLRYRREHPLSGVGSEAIILPLSPPGRRCCAPSRGRSCCAGGCTACAPIRSSATSSRACRTPSNGAGSDNAPRWYARSAGGWRRRARPDATVDGGRTMRASTVSAGEWRSTAAA